ncbi:MAG: hypothetical protein HY791_02770 [Deltaproteobacteria bacterium]|nr:hypothetical protein [Deltaproteobacteria bacterium]
MRARALLALASLSSCGDAPTGAPQATERLMAVLLDETLIQRTSEMIPIGTKLQDHRPRIHVTARPRARRSRPGPNP